MAERTDVQRALAAGARRSMRACSLPADDAFPVVLWRRHRWKIVGVLLAVGVELIGLGTAVGGGMNHF